MSAPSITSDRGRIKPDPKTVVPAFCSRSLSSSIQRCSISAMGQVAPTSHTPPGQRWQPCRRRPGTWSGRPPWLPVWRSPSSVRCSSLRTP